jgi:predicted nucleic acid-binding protein
VNFLLDTNVISEGARPLPDPGVMQWLTEVDESRTYLSVITLAELRHGVDRLPSGRRRAELEYWLSDALPARFGARLIDVNAAIADEWGRTVASAQQQGRIIGAMDAFLAATARAHSLTLVTRNIRDFDATGIALLNPWSV